jgi:hypothetical protein
MGHILGGVAIVVRPKSLTSMWMMVNDSHKVWQFDHLTSEPLENPNGAGVLGTTLKEKKEKKRRKPTSPSHASHASSKSRSRTRSHFRKDAWLDLLKMIVSFPVGQPKKRLGESFRWSCRWSILFRMLNRGPKKATQLQGCGSFSCILFRESWAKTCGATSH